ncbi:regulation of nuclear pre-mRNA domain-containing protein 2 isoform X1 [Spodoptera frugiperda]|uniref:Regulation of nuclear pre-mRNA domain-containing protein 2 n=3 Tax=Spodoptera frugiperda TaxID=7108 RepID=A0A9R0EYZ7_SPOFR|nr:regulation of nuclear pre-mRNA domain-containing protein 2 isoform X1 [Spodoptera frugiperda]
MGEAEEFNTLAFEKRLMHLKDTQESIQGLSAWCLKQRPHHKKIVSSWLNVLKRVKVEQRLVLFYLANDVIQYSKRKNYEFVESWGLNLQKATPLVRDDKVRPKILRIFKIWEQRSVYDDEFLSDLTGLLSAGAVKKSDDDSEFQPSQLVNKIKQCSVLEADTDLRLKEIHESHLELSDAELLRASLKERGNKDDVEKELNDGIACVERYTAALQREIVAREALLALLSTATQYYATQRGEVKVVAYAYKNFGARVKALKRKLDELIPTLPNAAPSPPQRDEDVPSPGPDEDLELPVPENTGDDDEIAYNIDQTFNSSIAADGSLYNLGLTSFLTSENPMALFNESSDILNSTNKIEVINSRPKQGEQEFNINDVLKNLMSDNNTNASDNNSVTSASMSQKSQDTLPGLDLLTPDTPGNPPPPTSFYGTMDLTEEPEPYHQEAASSWNSTNWSMPRVNPTLNSNVFTDTPESPPPAPRPIPPPEPVRYPQEIPTDVDHRGILPPPPPPPVLPLLGQLEDVDHRMLPALSPVPPVVNPAPVRHPVHQDVDHRNLISLTHQPTPPPQPINSVSRDQDYRVPPLVPPSDIVESVDMDLSEDEDQQGMYANQNQVERRHSFNNNNKVLVGGDNGKVHNEHNHKNLIQINSDKKEPHSAPVMPPMVNPFDAMPPSLKNFNMNFQKPLNFPKTFDLTEDNSNDSAYEEDLRSRGLDKTKHHEIRNPSPPFEDFGKEEWQQHQPRFMNPRFPRNWGPRTNFRPPGFSPQQGWPRNGPRPNRWMGPRPRFW